MSEADVMNMLGEYPRPWTEPNGSDVCDANGVIVAEDCLYGMAGMIVAIVNAWKPTEPTQ